MKEEMTRRPMTDKYDLKNILFGIRQLYQVIRKQPGFDYEKRSLKNAIRILSHNMPRKALVVENEYRCPRCGHLVSNYFCAECGQRIWWKDSIRPFDEKRTDEPYKNDDFAYINLQERRELEWYVRVHSIQWVLDKLSVADRHNQPEDKSVWKQWAKHVHYRIGDDLTQYDPDYPSLLKSIENGAEYVPRRHGESKHKNVDGTERTPNKRQDRTDYWNEYWKKKKGEQCVNRE